METFCNFYSHNEVYTFFQELNIFPKERVDQFIRYHTEPVLTFITFNFPGIRIWDIWNTWNILPENAHFNLENSYRSRSNAVCENTFIVSSNPNPRKRRKLK